MNSASSSTEGSSSVDVDALRALMTTATQHLLGDTIAVTDEQWRGLSRLPGWSRGHVATHLARQADALVRVIQGARSGTAQPMYAEPGQREQEIEAGAQRTGLDLQIDLDTSAGALSEVFDAVAHESHWETVVELRGGNRTPLRLLPLARLSEVVLHHVDLDVGLDIENVDEPTADWLLEWVAFRVGGREDFPRIHVRSGSGVSLSIGTAAGSDGRAEYAAEVSGGSAALLGWLTGRADGATLSGADRVTLPPF